MPNDQFALIQAVANWEEVEGAAADEEETLMRGGKEQANEVAMVFLGIFCPQLNLRQT